MLNSDDKDRNFDGGASLPMKKATSPITILLLNPTVRLGRGGRGGVSDARVVGGAEKQII
tara:strand:+ start:270 stop:449 length:180 start_codon:yes stop_codon:yes gene_type:complete